MAMAVVLILGTAVIFTGPEPSVRHFAVLDGPNHFVSLEANFFGLSLQVGGRKPHPPGGPIGRSAGDFGFDLAALAFYLHTVEWRNAAVQWQFLEFAFPWWLIIAFAIFRPLYRAFCAIDESRERLARERMNLLLHRPITHCPECGYDLRATPERCPECGRVIRSP